MSHSALSLQKPLSELTFDELIKDSELHAMGDPVLLSHGVVGHTVKSRKKSEITVLFILSIEQGKGNVGRYIDHLKTEYNVIKFPNLISGKLEQILLRRGFEQHFEWDILNGCDVDVYIWRNMEGVND